MSPRAGDMLIQEVAPRLRAVIPYIKPVGAEDSEELYQDSLCVAAKMLHDLEQRGKEVTSGNICFYVTLTARLVVAVSESSQLRTCQCHRADANRHLPPHRHQISPGTRRQGTMKSARHPP